MTFVDLTNGSKVFPRCCELKGVRMMQKADNTWLSTVK
jgi:hypothetical protein